MIITLASALMLVGAVLLVALVWSLLSLRKHHVRRASGWKAVLAFTAVLAMVDASDFASARRRQSIVPAECRASFERSFDYAPALLTVSPSYTWDTTKCPNIKVPYRIAANDAAGNIGAVTGTLSVLNMGRVPILGFETATQIYPLGGYVELITSDVKKRTFGLSDENFRFSWSIVSQNNEAWVVENGVLRSIRPAPRGSILRLSVSDGTVTYLRNGVVFFTSPRKMLASSKVQVDVEDDKTLLGLLTIAGGAR